VNLFICRQFQRKWCNQLMWHSSFPSNLNVGTTKKLFRAHYQFVIFLRQNRSFRKKKFSSVPSNVLGENDFAVNWLCWFRPCKWTSILVTIWRHSNPGTTKIPSRRTALMLLLAKFLPKNSPVTRLTSSLTIQLFLVTEKTNFNSCGANSPLHMILGQSCSSLNLTTYFSKIGFNAQFPLRHLCCPTKENFC